MTVAAGKSIDLALIRDLQEIGRLRNQAEERRVHQQRLDATAAAARNEPTTVGLSHREAIIKRDTARLYTKLVKLETVGKIRWDDKHHRVPKGDGVRFADWAGDWVKRPVISHRSDKHRPPAYTIDEILDKFDNVRRSGKRWQARCAAHEDKSPSLSITEGDICWLLRCFAGCTFLEITGSAGLDPQRMFFQ